MIIIIWLVVWNHGIFMTFHILGIITRTDELIFFKMVETTNQLIMVMIIYNNLGKSWFMLGKSSPTGRKIQVSEI